MRFYISPLSLAKIKFDDCQKRCGKTGVAGIITDVISLESNLITGCNLKYQYSLTQQVLRLRISHTGTPVHAHREAVTEQKPGRLCRRYWQRAGETRWWRAKSCNCLHKRPVGWARPPSPSKPRDPPPTAPSAPCTAGPCDVVCLLPNLLMPVDCSGNHII